jgi:hypothetical protein
LTHDESAARPELLHALVRLLDAVNGKVLAWFGRTPNGWPVVLSQYTIDHIRTDRRRYYVTIEFIQDCVRDPDFIKQDLRRSDKRHYLLYKRTVDPHGKIKMKHRCVALKKCRKLFFITVYYVDTAMRVSKLTKHTKMIWSKADVS